MPNVRRFVRALFVAGAAAAITVTPTGMTLMSAPGQAVVAQPHGAGGPDGTGGGGGCGNDRGWQGCAGFLPGQGGFGHGCIGNVCGSWDGARGWFSG